MDPDIWYLCMLYLEHNPNLSCIQAGMRGEFRCNWPDKNIPHDRSPRGIGCKGRTVRVRKVPLLVELLQLERKIQNVKDKKQV